MRIAVIGAGALGAYFGALLARDGHDVTLTARGANLAALREHGVRITGATELVVPVPVTDDAAGIGPVDLVLLAVKATQLDEVLPTLRSLMGEQTAVITLQNGLEAPQLVADVLGREHVLPGIVRIYTRLAEPGVVDHMGGPGSITFAEWDDVETERSRTIREALVHAGIVSERPASIWQDLWHKVMFVVPTGLLGSLADAPLGLQRTELRSSLRAVMDEVCRVGLASGVDLDGAVEATMAFADRMPEGATTSMQRDIAEGIAGELDPLVGGVRRKGEQVGVETPLFDLGQALVERRLQLQGQQDPHH